MNFDYALVTKKSLEQAVDDVKEALKELKFGTLWELDVPSKLKEKGVDFKGKARILEVCNPHKAKAVLEKDMNVIYFLPCKVVVYEDQGEVRLGMVRPTVFMEMLESEGLQDFAREVEETIKTALHKAQ
ncbi:DUF302 domain-containing protein [Metallumcola ferriviriculae]|uniref:DUF302 domain-containing protein n=1 Tax=Metallumcola ferriviriculae TaxID=3039180 RepID=A0AAU0UKD4_9FIRM|nr:DUF302 domain-containing protein [Desulfitibacteraceae bacterium MK1]